ncbi:hypothetical protein V3391_16845 [Luteimonas sp. SMYT11W]|uniref:DUF4440 domain-containing protein n=1 Tax=Luteimonas flava TaxID=3115822 RepID=A0ABU7WL20_9GAMM
MRAVIIGIITFGLTFAGASHAQDSSIQTRMGEAEFQAAGLQKLDATELARLDAWLVRQLADASTASATRGQSVSVARGAMEATEVDSTLVHSFTGFSKGREYVLANGQVWRQTDDAALPGVALENAAVQIRAARFGGWWMKVHNYNTRARVERIK